MVVRWIAAVLACLVTPGATQAAADTGEVRSGLPLDDPGERDLRWAIGIRTARHFYVDLATGEEECYDLATEPHEYRNLATVPGHADNLALLRAQLQRFRACDVGACARSLPPEPATRP